MKLLKKFIIFTKSGGIKEAINYSYNSFKTLFYTNSQTLFMYLYNDIVEEKVLVNNLNFIYLSNLEDAQKYKFDRLFAYPIEKWFKEGAVCQIVVLNSEPVSFLWIHKQNREINRAITVQLAKNNYWIGPVFVHKNIRGKGINKAQLNYLLNNKEYRDVLFLTCTNSDNLASLSSFAKLGFEIGVITRYKKILFRDSQTNLVVFKNNVINYQV